MFSQEKVFNFVKDFFIKHENAAAFTICAILISAVYSPVVFFNKSLQSAIYHPYTLTDEGAYGYEGRKPAGAFNVDVTGATYVELPTNRLIGEIYKSGHLPLWNPYKGAGEPIPQQLASQVFFPYQILEDIAPWWTTDFFYLGRLLIVGFFTFLFLRTIKLSKISSLVGGVFYMFSGTFVWFINNEQMVNSAMMIPVVMLGIEKLMQKPATKNMFFVAASLALLAFSGPPGVIAYSLILFFSYILFRLFIEKSGNFPIPSKKRFIFFLLLAVVMAVGLSAPLTILLPAHLNDSLVLRDNTGKLTVSFWNLILIFLPNLSDLKTSYNFGVGNGQWDEAGSFIGIIPLVFIIFGIILSRKIKQFRIFLFFLIFGLIILLKNYGLFLNELLGRMPILDKIWSPRWSGPVWTFSLICAATFGFELIKSKLKKLWNKKDPIALTCVFGVILIERWFFIPFGYETNLIKILPLIFAATAIIFILKNKFFIAVVFGFLFVPIFGIADSFSPTGLPNRFNPFNTPPFIKFLKQNMQYYRVLGTGGILMPNMAGAFGIQDFRHISGTVLKDFYNFKKEVLGIADFPLFFMNTIFKNLSPGDSNTYQWLCGRNFQPSESFIPLETRIPFYSLLGIKYFLIPNTKNFNDIFDVKDPALFKKIYDNEIKIYENPFVLPRAFMVTNVEYVETYYEAQEKLKTLSLGELKNKVFLENNGEKITQKNIKIGNSNNKQNAEIIYYSPQKIVININAGSPRFLILTDAYHDGWQATADGKPIKIYRANGLFRGVFVKPNIKQIIFEYRPLNLLTSAILSYDKNQNDIVAGAPKKDIKTVLSEKRDFEINYLTKNFNKLFIKTSEFYKKRPELISINFQPKSIETAFLVFKDKADKKFGMVVKIAQKNNPYFNYGPDLSPAVDYLENFYFNPKNIFKELDLEDASEILSEELKKNGVIKTLFFRWLKNGKIMETKVYFIQNFYDFEHKQWLNPIITGLSPEIFADVFQYNCKTAEWRQVKF